MSTKRILKSALIAMAAVMSALSGTTAKADHALVVGVNQYPGLETNARLLGAVNDATLVAAKLKSLGFTVTSLTDQQATKDEILNALGKMHGTVQDNERFVFYYAGCGTVHTDGSDFILPYDASGIDFSTFISQFDLYDAVSGIPAKSRTVVIDAGFNDYDYGSGSAVAAKAAKLKSRFYYSLKRNVLAPDPTVEPPIPMAADTDQICYYVAAKETQSAYEREFGGSTHGIFTYYLVPRITPGQTKWAALNSDLSNNITKQVGNRQLPVVSQVYRPGVVFDPMATLAAPRPNRAMALWQALYGVHSAKRLSVEAYGSPLVLQVRPAKTDTSSFVVVLSKNKAGDVKLVYPVSRNADDGAAKGDSLAVPLPSVANGDRVKTILFASKADAQKLLVQFPATGVVTKALDPKSPRPLHTQDVATFYTAEIDTNVVVASK